MGIRLLLLVTVASAIGCGVARAECSPEHPPLTAFQSEPGTSVRGPLSIEALERENMITIRETGQVLPFGYAHKAWVSFKDRMKLGDSIYWFSNRNGRVYMDGHFLVRDGCVVGHLPGASVDPGR